MKQFSLIITALFLLLFSSSLFGQNSDLITKVDGYTIQGKVLKVTETEVEFDPQGDIPFIILNRTDVASILYSNGTVVKLNEVRTVNVVKPEKKEQSLEINYRSNDAFENALDKLFGSSNRPRRIIGDIINSTDKITTGKEANLVTEYKFIDKNGKDRFVRVEAILKKGMYQALEAKYYLDGNLIETKVKEKNEILSDKMQWINSTIPNDRVLVSIFNEPARISQNNVTDYWLICVLKRVDNNPKEPNELVLIKENASLNKIRPSVLIEKELTLKKDIISEGLNFYSNDAYFIGKDNELHYLRIETDHDYLKKLPWRNSCRVILDDQIIKEVNEDFKKNRDVLEFNFQTGQGNSLGVKIDLSSYNKAIRVVLLD